jgi:hypothetical protein
VEFILNNIDEFLSGLEKECNGGELIETYKNAINASG